MQRSEVRGGGSADHRRCRDLGGVKESEGARSRKLLNGKTYLPGDPGVHQGLICRGRPYSSRSAVVKSSRPLGIAVIALLFKYLQCTAADGKTTPRRRRRVATRRGRHKSHTGVRGSTRLASRQSAETSRSEHAGREGSAYGELRAMRLPRVHGGATAVPVRVGDRAHGESWASVQDLERRGEVKQAHRYLRNGVVVQVPAVYHGGSQKDTTAARRRVATRRGISRTQGSAAAHTVGIATTCRDK